MKNGASDILLDVRGLEIRYGAATAVRGVDLQVRRGELVAVIGNNGAGKTSILRGISGLVRPQAGTVMFKGEDTASFAAYKKVDRGLALIPEGRLIFADQTVEDNLILGAYSRWTSQRKAVLGEFEEMFALFPRLKERLHQRAGSLSGGEQQMLAMARGLLSKPDLLMIDEMSLGLAPIVVRRLVPALRRIADAGVGVILIEQFTHLALDLASDAYAMAQGRVVVHAPAADLQKKPETLEQAYRLA